MEEHQLEAPHRELHAFTGQIFRLHLFHQDVLAVLADDALFPSAITI